MSRRRVVVIGAGHNGLTAAAMIARDPGHDEVIVLEAREDAGGLCARVKITEGYTVPGIFHDTSLLRPAIADVLALERHGLRWRKDPLKVCAPVEGGKPLWITPTNVDGERDSLPPKEGATDAGYASWRAFIARIAPVLRDILDRAPADPTGQMWPLVRTGLRVRRLGRQDMLELLRIAPMAAGDWLREAVADERLRTALAHPALEAGFVGPWSPGTAGVLLLREALAGNEVEGGPAALADALEAAATTHGATVRRQAPVASIRVEGKRVRAVVLEGGEELAADVVVATCDPRHTFLSLVGARKIPQRLADDIRVVRMRGTTAKVHLALSGPLELADGTAVECLRTGEKLDDLERAFDPVKYRSLPERPMVEARVWSASDVCPEGHSVVSLLVHHAPFDLEGGWTDAQKERLADAAVRELARHCPTVPERIVARDVLSPADLASRYRLTGGHLHHGEHAIDQLLFMRPTVDCARYATPITGLYLGGSGSHPGGGVTCAPGALAARAVLENWTHAV
jgi:phytoene dehydrogenase-like protein